MQGVFGNRDVVASEIQGQFRPGRDEIVTPLKWVIVARALWPLKTAAHLASVAGKDERTAKRWLAGEFEPPGIIIAAMVAEMFKREVGVGNERTAGTARGTQGASSANGGIQSSAGRKAGLDQTEGPFSD